MRPSLKILKRWKPKKMVRIWAWNEISAQNCSSFMAWARSGISSTGSILVIDLQNVDYINAAGLTAMIWVNRAAVDEGINLKWMNLEPNVARLLKMTNLEKVLDYL